jgi:hypothetical protein
VVIAVPRGGDLAFIEAVEGVFPRHILETRARHRGDGRVVRQRHPQAVVGEEPAVAVAEHGQARADDLPALLLGSGVPLVEREEERERLLLAE